MRFFPRTFDFLTLFFDISACSCRPLRHTEHGIIPSKSFKSFLRHRPYLAPVESEMLTWTQGIGELWLGTLRHIAGMRTRDLHPVVGSITERVGSGTFGTQENRSSRDASLFSEWGEPAICLTWRAVLQSNEEGTIIQGFRIRGSESALLESACMFPRQPTESTDELREIDADILKRGMT